ncbi:MAG: hypothetical protein FJ100_22730, partial [Deltaproteobacteria bacterium]|nr:hypothetical protein [Deltaproteobacteria bacterium]
TAAVLKLASTVGVTVGQPLAVVSDGETHVITPVRIDGDYVTLAATLPSVPDTGATVKGLRMTATVTAVGVAELGAGLQLEWRYNNATAAGYATQEVAVVRWLWQQPITAAEIAELLGVVYQTTRSPDFCEGISERVSNKIRAAIEQTGRRPYLYASPSAFAEVAQIGARWVLAESNIGLVGDLPALVREYRFAFNDELTKAVAGLRGYDATAEGRLDQPKRSVISIPTSR